MARKKKGESVGRRWGTQDEEEKKEHGGMKGIKFPPSFLSTFNCDLFL